MTYLLLSVVALGLGPVLLKFSGNRPRVLQFLDGLVLASVVVLVVGGFLPHATEIGGWFALLAFVLGLIAPSMIEKLRGHLDDEVHTATIYLGMSALVLHALTDGVAFSNVEDPSNEALALAVLLHRLPVGLAAWWLVRTTRSARSAALVLVAIAGATGIGYILGVQIALIHSTWFVYLLAFVAGSLFHVLMHQHLPAEISATVGKYRWAETAGAMFGIATLVVATSLSSRLDHHHHWWSDVAGRFLHFGIESAPALLFGYVLAGLVVYFLPAASIRWLKGGGAVRQAGKGVMFGLPLPVCSCGVVPLYSSLVRAGTPAAAGAAFLVATPELGIEAFVLSFPLLGLELTMLRLGAALVLAFGVAFAVYRWMPEMPETQNVDLNNVDRSDSLPVRIVKAIRYGLVEVLDDTAVWIVAGLGIAALIAPDVLQPAVAKLPYGLDILLCAVIGIPMYVCASGATPLAAALIAAGLSPGAAITFLLSGPATNVTTFGMLSRLHSTKTAVIFGVSVISISAMLGFAVNALIAKSFNVGVGQDMQHGALAWAALAVLSVAFAGAVLRQGPREFVSTLFEFGGHHDDEVANADSHSCGHCC